MAKHMFVFVSKDSEFKLGKDKSAEISGKNPGVSFMYFENNDRSLAEVYNSVLDSEDAKNFDFIYLMHADVSLDFEALTRHVESVAGKYDVIGLCGCAGFSVSQSPLNWFCGSRQAPDRRWGCVTHGELGNQTSFFSQHHPDTTDHEVACIDGLCIIFTRKAVDSGMRFDSGLGKFDFYDTDISMQSILKYKLRLGVVVRKDLSHFSVGKSILTEQFLSNELKFRSKWGFPVPEGSPVSRIANAAGTANA